MSAVVLIRGPAVLSAGRIGAATACAPLGIAYLAAYILKNGKSMTIIDAYGEDPFRKTDKDGYFIYGLLNEDVMKIIPQGAKVVGFSCMFSNEWIYLKEIIKDVRKHFPDAVIVLGGEHATALTEYCLSSCKELDYVIRGEGEWSFSYLIDFIMDGKGRIEDIGGLAYRASGEKIFINPPAGRINNLDEIPWPAWHLVPLENYLKNGIAIIGAKGSRIMPILASRGCPYSCKFCSSKRMWGRLYRIRDYENVINEIKYYKEKYNITGFELHDTTFIMNKKWTIAFAKRLIEEGLLLNWNVQATRSEAIDKDVINYLFESGCKNLTLTPDSGSKKQIIDMDKKVDLKKITERIKILNRKKIILKVNLVIGFPNERHNDIWKSILFGIKLSLLGTSNITFYRFVPYPGSDYFELLQERKMIPDYGNDFDRFLVTNIYNELSDIRSYSKNISDTLLKYYLFFGYIITQLIHLISHPWHIFKMISRIVDNKPQSQIEGLIINLMRKIAPQWF